MKSWMVFALVSGLTQSPALGVVAVALLWLAGGSWWIGRLPDAAAPYRRWVRIRRLRDVLANNPHDVPARTDLAGLLARRSPQEARELLTEVLRRYPEEPLGHHWLGIALLELGETAKGHAAIDEALRLRKDLRWGEPGLFLGDHYARLGRHAEAVAAYHRALEVHGSLAEAWWKAGASARAAGDLAAAKHFFSSTLSRTEGAPPYKRRQDRLWRWRAWWALRTS